MSNQRNFMMDPMVPRTAPRIPINPVPFNFEKPIPQVPEVSLIFDSSLQNNSRTRASPLANTNSDMVNVQPAVSHCQSVVTHGQQPALHSPPVVNYSQATMSQPPHYIQQNNFEIRVLYDIIKKQEETILRLESNVNVMSENQTKQWKSVEDMLKILLDRTSVKSPHVADQGVQTDDSKEIVIKPPVMMEQKTVGTGNLKQIQSQTSPANLPRVEKSRSSSSSSSSYSLEIDNNFGNNSPIVQDFVQKSPAAVSDIKENKPEDLSTILKDLQLPTIQENSIFSEVSIRSIDLQEYNDSFNDTKSDTDSPDVGPSASNFGSSSEEEEVRPTVTFYRNVIGNVNKMLEGNQEITMYGSTDTTVYGMSSTNLSFATKQYLQKYGLVKHRESPNEKQKEKVKLSKRGNGRDGNDGGKASPPNDRILDLKSLRNKPKFT